MNQRQTNTAPAPASGDTPKYKNGRFTIRRCFIEDDNKRDLYELRHESGGESGFIDHATMKQILLGYVDAAVILAACQEEE